MTSGTVTSYAGLDFGFGTEIASAEGGFGAVGANGVAVDDATPATVYLARTAAGKVDSFAVSTGVQGVGLDGSSTPTGSFGEPGGVAANNGSGEVYVLDTSDGVVDVFSSTGGYVCEITGAGSSSSSLAEECDTSSNPATNPPTPAGHFSSPGGIAVDQASGELYVLDAGNAVVDVFNMAGVYLRQVSLASIPGGPGSVSGIAVDDHNNDLYVSDNEPSAIYVFNASGEYQATWEGAATPEGSFGAAERISVAADNTSGDVYVISSAQTLVNVFKGTATPGAPEEYIASHLAQPLTSPKTITVDQATQKLYITTVVTTGRVLQVFGPGVLVPDVKSGPVGTVGPTEAELQGGVDPDGVALSECEFEYGTSETYGESVPCEPEAMTIPADETEHAVTAHLTGLAPGIKYHFRLKAANTNGSTAGADIGFETPPAPSISDAEALGVTSSTATLTGEVNPNGYKTTYQFQWGTSTTYGHDEPEPEGELGEGNTNVRVEDKLTGLHPSIPYHWRIVARSINGTVDGADHTFIYNESSAGGLPENRAYEMVTPPQKNAALIGDAIGSPLPDVAENGSKVILGSIQCFAGASSCVGAHPGIVGSPYLFTRTPTGWKTTPLAPPAAMLTENSWLGYSADAETALFAGPNPVHGEDDFYARQPNGTFTDIGPLTPPANGPTPIEASLKAFSTTLLETASLSHMAYQSLPVGWSVDEAEGLSALEYTGTANSEPTVVGVSGPEGSHSLISTCETTIGGQEGERVTVGALSADGRTVLFTAGTCKAPAEGGSGVNSGVEVPVRELFARVDGEEPNAHTVSVSQPNAAATQTPDLECTTTECQKNITEEQNWRDAYFVGASSDSSKVFFTDTQQLTDNATEDPSNKDSAHNITGETCVKAVAVNGCNLYLFGGVQESPLGGDNLVDVSACGGCPGGPRVQGVVAISPDGSHVYFVARGVLTGAANSQGVTARDGAENLYVWQHQEGSPGGRVAFIASLPESEKVSWDGELGEPWNVSPDGRFLVFTSAGLLTGDDSRDNGGQQVFRYDAETGVLVRVSVGEDGFDDDGNGGVGDASIVPGIQGYSARAGVGRPDPTMSNDGGLVFFMSPVGLTSQALNDAVTGVNEHGEQVYAENVYEWRDGQVYLISDGRDTSSIATQCSGSSSVCLLGVDASGANVFFSTADQLVKADTDTQVDIYDARICTSGDPCVAQAAAVSACLEEACHGTPGVAPSVPAPGSSLFSGAGNIAPVPVAVKPLTAAQVRAAKLVKALKACRVKHNKGRRVACEKQARRSYGPVKAKAKAKKSRMASKSSRSGRGV